MVFTTSINAVLGRPGSSGYAASKAAQASMVRVFAGELVDRGVRVNGVRTGPLPRPCMNAWDDSGANRRNDRVHRQRSAHATLRHPSEIAKAIAFLAGPDASYVTGEELTVDGGMSRL